jgi:ATP-binding cassette subfamily B (MDR/TAP) protein 10
MSPQLALVGLAVVPPLAGMAIIYGRFVRKIAKSVQVQSTARFHQLNRNFL